MRTNPRRASSPRYGSKADLIAALEAVTMLTKWGQFCFNTHNGIPMGMSRKQERLVKLALNAPKGTRR